MILSDDLTMLLLQPIKTPLLSNEPITGILKHVDFNVWFVTSSNPFFVPLCVNCILCPYTTQLKTICANILLSIQ